MTSDWHIINPEWDVMFTLPKTRLTLKGYSRGSERTGFFIPELKTFVDGGVRSNLVPDRILVTHCHGDHTAALPMLMSGMPKGHKVEIIVPSEHEKLFEDFLKSSYYLNRGGHGNFDSRAIIRGWAAHDAEMTIKKGNSIYVIKGYELDHSVPTLGYGFFEIRKKLKAEHVGKSGKELAELRKLNDDIHEEITVPQILFAFDTSIKPFVENPQLLKFPNVVVECTFFEPYDRKKASESKHIHWDQLRPFVESNPSILFILTHFSMRYTMANICSFFSTYCSGHSVRNLKVWKC